MNTLPAKSHLKRIMEERGVTVREMARLARVDVTTVMRARSDTDILTCTLDTLYRIAEALSVNPKDLYDAGTVPEKTS